MRSRLVGVIVAVVALVLVVFSVPLVRYVERVERDRLLTALERDSYALAVHARDSLAPEPGAEVPSLVPFINEHGSGRGVVAIVTNADGRAVATNDADVILGESYARRPEIVSALAGEMVAGERASRTLGDRLVYVAVPVLRGDEVVGAVRLSSTRSSVDTQVRENIVAIAVAGLLTLGAASVVALVVAVGIARPIRRLTTTTEHLAEGDFGARADDSSGPAEVRELSRSFNAMAGRVGLLVEGQRQFAGAVSHQLRTPLTALRLRLETASALAAGEDELASSLEASLAETDRMQSMVEQLLALARLESGSSPTVTVDAANIVRERADMWRPLADEKGVTIEVAGDSVARCAVLEGALEQIVDNYVDNALTVAPRGSSIVVSARTDDAHVVVEVVDAGPGLSAEQRALAFERFWRAPTSTSTTGSGLGLSIVRQLALASGGTAELLDGHGRGVRATATFAAR